LRNPKDQRPPLSSARVYKILCSCGKVYIGEIGKNGNMKERDVKLKHITQSVLSEHNIETGNQILFDKMTTIVLSLHIFQESTGKLEIQKRPDNLNRDNSYNMRVEYGRPFSLLSKIDRLVNLKK